MSKEKAYRVLREHDGDRSYKTGDTRVADPADVAHLIGRVLEEVGATVRKRKNRRWTSPKSFSATSPRPASPSLRMRPDPMSVRVVTPPAPFVSVADAKKHLLVDHGDDDLLIEG